MHFGRPTRLLGPLLCLAMFTAGCSNGGSSADDGGIAADTQPVSDAGLISDLPNRPKGNPLNPEIAAYPFPSDFYLTADDTTVTKRRVDLPEEVLPPIFLAENFNSADGFSRIPAILAHFPQGIDPASLPDPNDPKASIADDSPAFLVDAETGSRIPALIELDATSKDTKRQALILRPHLALAPNRGYVVIIRNKLRGLDGNALEANDAFRALRDDLPTDCPELEKQREDFQLVRAAMDRLELDPSEVVLAWSFHTRSEQQVVRPLLAMHDVVNSATLGPHTVISDTLDTSQKNRVITASIKAPNFLTAGSLFELDQQGKPVQQGERDMEFLLVIPAELDATRPVLVFGHGFFGEKSQAVTGSLNPLLQEYKFSAIATNFIGLNVHDQAKTLALLGAELHKVDTFVAQQLQSHLHFTVLARLVRERLAGEITHDAGSGPVKVLDGQQVHYIGGSNGGTQGFVIAAASPAFTRAALVAPGAGISHMLQRAVQWNSLDTFLRVIYSNPLDLQLGMSLIQLNLDPMDGLNYIEHLVSDRFEGRPPLKATLHMAIADCEVANLVTEWAARTAEIPLITPAAKQVWGLDTVTAPPPDGATDTNGALYIYDEKYAPLTPTNVPPPFENGAHFSMRVLDVYKQHVATFLETGKIVQVCDGECDPD